MHSSVVLSVLLALLASASLCVAHEDESFLYRNTRYGLGDPDIQCWQKTIGANVTSISAPCPPGLNINFTGAVPVVYLIDVRYNISFQITASIDDPITSVPDITHANVHGCTQAAGFCSPILAAQPGLVSFYGQATANLSRPENITVVTSPVVFSSIGSWTMICHGRFFTGGPTGTQWDFANGITVTVRKQITKTSKGALIAMGVFGGLVAVLIVAMLIGIIFYRRHKVVRAATFPFCVIMLICGLISLGTIIPLGVSPPTDDSCIAIPWLLAPATCLTLSLLALRLFRVHILFGEAALHPDMKRYWYLRNIYLLAFAAVITGIQVLMLVFWSAIPAWRPRRVERVGDISTGFACGSRNGRAMPALYWTFVAMDAIILGVAVVLAFVTRKVTTLFNESKAIALITYTFVFVGFVIIPIQKLVDDVTGTFVLRSAGIILGVGAAIILLFGPKFWVIFTTDRHNLRGIAEYTDSPSYSRDSSMSSGEFDVAPIPNSKSNSTVTDKAIDKKTIDRLDAATARAVTLLEKHKTGFRVGQQELQEVIDGLKAI